jgi:hypothetical protein
MAERLVLNLNDVKFEPFDVNDGIQKGATDIGRLPSLSDRLIGGVDDYAASWVTAGKSLLGMMTMMKDFASSLPPSTQSFGRISYMPNNSTSQLGVLQWPGLPPDSLAKLAREMMAHQMIVKLRCSDITRYVDKSVEPWRPGWHIEPMDPQEKNPDAHTLKEIRDAEQFLLNGGYGPMFSDPLQRDQLLRCGFPKFLNEIVRDSLTYDAIAIWTDMDDRGRINSFVPMPSKNIRLLARPDRAKISEIHEGELNFYGESSMTGKQPTIDSDNPPFAVAVDETNNIVRSFTREQLIWYNRNPRVDAEIGGYGYPELEMALMLVTGFNNAIQFNADIFDKNSIPKGILAIKGNFTQRQFDALGRIWDNLQRGNRTDWTLPAIQLSEKGEIEVINLESLRKEPAYYNNLINLFMGAMAIVYDVPPHRLGYKISGTERDSRPDLSKTLQSEEDNGLPALLTHIEILVNTYLLHNRWPHLKFVFTGKSPKEDARLYEISLLTKTVNERRLLVGDPPYETAVPPKATDVEKTLARLMGMAPVDTALVPIFQASLAAMVKAGLLGGTPESEQGPKGPKNDGEGGKMDMPGVRFPAKKDPAKSEDHGHTSGVRRDSAKEKKPPNLRRRLETHSTPDTQSYSGTTKTS